jgi:histone-lysine N-methyltransferase SETMAR
MKKERVRMSELFLAMVRCCSMSILDNIVTIDESAVSFHTPETKQQSVQWLPKGQPGPVNAKNQTNCFGVFQFQGPNLYKLHAQEDHGECQLHHGGPGHVHEDFEEEEAADGGRRLAVPLGQYSGSHRHQSDQAARDMKLIEHLPYSPNLAPTDYFLFPRVKRELAGLTLTQDTFKKEWEGAVRSITTADFAEAFRRWFQRHKKCVLIGGGYVEKS